MRTENGKKDMVRDMFDDIAPKYDLLNHCLSLGIDKRWRKKLVKIVSETNPKSILDLATGTGDLAIAMAKKLPDVKITGGDISVGMLDYGKVKVSKQGLSEKISFCQTEAESLPFENDSFDAVTVAFGVRNYHNLHQGITESYRVIKTGGILAILEFSKPRNRIFGAIYRFYFHRILPVAGGLVSRNFKAYKYLPESVDDFPQPEQFLKILSDAGFIDCKARSLTNGVAYIYTAKKN